jgi:HD-GYP domain-containing protein (c-di-GMP phosphodiesterase class II)
MNKDGLILTEDIADVDGATVLPSGSVVNKTVLKKVEAKRPPFASLELQTRDIYQDFVSLVEEANYKATLPTDAMRAKVLLYLGRISLPEPMYRELEDMRARSLILYHHTLATTFLATRLVLEYLFVADDIIKVGSAALTRDVGMLRLPPELLKNTDHLSKQEYFRIKRHPLVSLVLLTHYMGDGLNSLVGFRHHDARKREGSPSKLMDLITMVDIFNALISPRSFRTRAFDVRGALDLLSEMVAKKEMNPDLVKLLVASYRQGNLHAREIVLSQEKLGFKPSENYYGVNAKT